MINRDPHRADRIVNYHVHWENSESSGQRYVDRPISSDESWKAEKIAAEALKHTKKTIVKEQKADLDSFEGHWAFGSLGIDEQALEDLLMLENDEYSSCFVFNDGTISRTERLQKTKEAIYQFPRDPPSIAIIIDYFQNRLQDFPENWDQFYLNKFTQDPSLRPYLSTKSHLSSKEKLIAAFRSVRPEHLPNVADLFFRSLSDPTEAAELRAKIDFTRIAARFSDPMLTVDDIFPLDEEIFRSINTWVESNRADLLGKKTFVLPANTQTIPMALVQNLPNIESIQMTQGSFITFPFEAIKNILQLPKLETLNLSNNSFTCFPVGLLRTALKLKTLNLSGNPLDELTQTNLRDYCTRHRITLMI